jgi:hypothetical protein
MKYVFNFCLIVLSSVDHSSYELKIVIVKNFEVMSNIFQTGKKQYCLNYRQKSVLFIITALVFLTLKLCW